jgi:hypothetical protein
MKSSSQPCRVPVSVAKGDPPIPLEHLRPYYRGARFAVLAMRRRHGHDPDIEQDADRYLAMLDRYSEAATATFKLRQQRGQASG